MEHLTNITEKLTELNLDDSTPQWAKILFFCMNELVNVVKENNTLNDRLLVLEDINEVRGTVIAKLQQENDSLKKELKLIGKTADDNEQKSRTSCLLIHGVEEMEGEDTDQLCLDIVNNEVGVTLSLADMERSHRIGPKKAQTATINKSRPIIFRFASIRKRIEVFKNKKNLKGKGYVITESLTKLRYQLLQRAKTKFGDRNVWTTEGRIFTKINNKLTPIESDDDLLLFR